MPNDPQDSYANAANNTSFPLRHRPAHGIKNVEGQPTIIFDTLCVKDRHPVLANDVFHDAFREIGQQATAWLIGRYIIMPDHIHLFAAAVGGGTSFENWIKYLKSQLTRKLGGRGACRTVPPFRWLPNHWDVRVRTADVYEQKWEYVLNNPVRQGLVTQSEAWPYQGEIHEIRWR